MLFWGIRASIPTKNSENKTVCVLFQGAFDGNAKMRRNISQKSINNEKLDILRIDFSKKEIVRIDAPMYCLDVSTAGTLRKYFKNQMFKDFFKL